MHTYINVKKEKPALLQRIYKKINKSGIAQCQRCLKKGHMTYECKNDVVYTYRPSATMQYKFAHLKQELNQEEGPKVTIFDADKRRQVKKDEVEEEMSVSSLKDSSSSSSSSSSSEEKVEVKKEIKQQVKKRRDSRSRSLSNHRNKNKEKKRSNDKKKDRSDSVKKQKQRK